MAKFSLSSFFMLFITVAFGQSKFNPGEKYLALSSKAFSLYNEKNYARSALLYDSLFKINKSKGLRVDKYNAACTWALAGNNDKAFFYLGQALGTGEWVNLPNLLSDSDLDSLHNDKRWQPFIDQVKIKNEIPERKLNKPLVTLLDTIFREDQGNRNNMDLVKEKYGWQSKQMDSLFKKMRIQDSINLAAVKHIIAVNGWPGPDKVGQQGSSTIFLVIQHADSLTQTTYLPVMRSAVKKGNAKPEDLALLEDRVLTRQGREQIYGSQLKIDSTGKYSFFPIKDEANVNRRRAKAGLGPLEDYAKFFGLEFVLPLPKRKK